MLDEWRAVVLLPYHPSLAPKAPFARTRYRSILRCKEKIYTMMGTNIETMVLQLNGQTLSNNDAYLADYNPKHQDVLHVIDNDPYSKALNGGLDNVNLVQKYVMTEEDYDKRENTYRAFKKKMLAKDPNWKPVGWKPPVKKGLQAEEKLVPQTLEEVQARMKVGDRCQAVGGRRGEVMYIGRIPELAVPEGTEEFVWVGVKLDLAEGKNDGQVKGRRYFQCEANCGAFFKSNLVEAGDFPEDDPFASSDDDDSDEDVMEEL